MARLKIQELHPTAFAALLGGAVAVLFCVLHLTGALMPLERTAYDWRFRRLARPELARKDVVIIALDNASFEARAMRENYGRWPWRRSLYALLLSYLHEANARAIGIDVTFAGADAHEGDDELFAHYLGQKANTVLALSFTDSPGAVEPEDSDLQPNQWSVENDACGPDRQYTGLDIALSKLNQKARALGSTTVERDPDGFLRRAPLLFRYQGAAYPAFALAVAAPLLGPETGSATSFETSSEKGSETVSQTNSEKGSAAGESSHRSAEFRCGNLLTAGSLSIGDLEIPVTADGDAMVYWYGGQSGSEYSFRHYPAWRISNAALDLHNGQTPEVPLAEFKDKIVLIGPSAVGIGDFHTSPFSSTLPGVEYQATLISNLLEGHFVSQAGEAWALLAIVLLSLGTSLAVWRFTDWRAYTVAAVGLALGFLALNLLLFHTSRVALVLVAPLGALAFTYATGNLTRYVTEGREKKRYRTTLMKYVAPQIVEAMTADRRLAELHNEKRDLTVLFSDVRGFTTMSEKLPVDQLVATLNEFLNAMVEVIFRNQGTLDKFVGDCVMAFWGAPLRLENHAELAARTALHMQAALEQLNQQWKQQGRPELKIGVGINSGEMIFGNIGSERRMDFTVIGDSVNLAARLESVTKELKASIVISDATYQRIADVAEVRDLGTIRVKGKDVPIRVYELLGMAGTAQKEKESYASA